MDVKKICSAYDRKTRTCGVSFFGPSFVYCSGTNCTYGFDIVKISEWVNLRLSSDIKDRWKARELYYEMVIKAVKEGECIPCPPQSSNPLAKNVPKEYLEREMELPKSMFDNIPFLFDRILFKSSLAYRMQFNPKWRALQNSNTIPDEIEQEIKIDSS